MDYDFCFPKCEKPFESYNGNLVRVRYYVNVIINRDYNKITKEQIFAVYNMQEEPAINRNICQHIGVGEISCVFELACTKFHLNDVILGKLTFKKSVPLR